MDLKQSFQDDVTIKPAFIAPYEQLNYNDDISEVDIIVEIKDPTFNKGQIKSFLTYTIKGKDNNGEFSCNRRYTDFKQVRKIMQKRWPACYVPPLPPKEVIDTNSFDLVDDRDNSLLGFCLKLSEIRYLWFSREFTLFLRCDQSELQYRFNELPQMTHDYLLHKYSIVFKQTYDKPLTLQVQNRLKQTRQMVEIIMPMMQNFKIISKNICQTRLQSHTEHFQLFVNLLPQYETIVLQEYIYAQDDRLIFSLESMNPEFKLLMDQNQVMMMSNDLFNFYEILRVQIKELKCLQETFKFHDNYLNEKLQLEQKQKELQLKLQRIMAGKVGITNFLKGVNKHELAQTTQRELQETEQAVKKVQFLSEILMKILGYMELDRFESTKMREYYSSVRIMAKFEIKIAALKQKFFELLLESPGFDPDRRHPSFMLDSSVRIQEVKQYIESRNSAKLTEEEQQQLQQQKENRGSKQENNNNQLKPIEEIKDDESV